MKDHQTHLHQKHHHKHCYACLSPAPTVWSLLCLCTRQLFYYFRVYSCFQPNGSTEVSNDYSCFQLNGLAEVSNAYLLGLHLQKHCFLGCLRWEYVPRLSQRGLSEGAKTAATVAAALVKQRAELVKFLPPGSCGSNNLQETADRDPTGAMFVTYVVAPTNAPTAVPVSPSVSCQGNSTSRLSEEGSSTPEPASHDGDSSLVLKVSATSTVPGRDVVF